MRALCLALALCGAAAVPAERYEVLKQLESLSNDIDAAAASRGATHVRGPDGGRTLERRPDKVEKYLLFDFDLTLSVIHVNKVMRVSEADHQRESKSAHPLSTSNFQYVRARALPNEYKHLEELGSALRQLDPSSAGYAKKKEEYDTKSYEYTVKTQGVKEDYVQQALDAGYTRAAGVLPDPSGCAARVAMRVDRAVLTLVAPLACVR